MVEVELLNQSLEALSPCRTLKASDVHLLVEPSSQLAVSKKCSLDHFDEGPHGLVEAHAVMQYLEVVGQLEVMEH